MKFDKIRKTYLKKFTLLQIIIKKKKKKKKKKEHFLKILDFPNTKQSDF